MTTSRPDGSAYREHAVDEYMARNWDITVYGAGSMCPSYQIIVVRDGCITRVSSAILARDNFGHERYERDIDAVASLGPGSRVHVASGKIYVLTGPRCVVHPDQNYSAMDPASMGYCDTKEMEKKVKAAAKKARASQLSWWVQLLLWAKVIELLPAEPRRQRALGSKT